MNELEVDPKRILLVLNKVDLIDSQSRSRIEADPMFREYNTVKVSAVRGDGMHQLKNRILEKTSSARVPETRQPPARKT
jgi:50S ribosomal subunit-associated GTPase HflX